MLVSAKRIAEISSFDFPSTAIAFKNHPTLISPELQRGQGASVSSFGWRIEAPKFSVRFNTRLGRGRTFPQLRR
jgi:hypothetical protein